MDQEHWDRIQKWDLNDHCYTFHTNRYFFFLCISDNAGEQKLSGFAENLKLR